MTTPIDCDTALDLLSAHLDGALADATPLQAHFGACAACRVQARALDELRPGWKDLRAGPPASGWARLEAAARRRGALRPRPSLRPPLALRAAAALVGFLGVGAAALVAERALRPAAPAAPRTHVVQRWVEPAGPGPATPLVDLPEYRLLRSLPRGPEESR